MHTSSHLGGLLELLVIKVIVAATRFILHIGRTRTTAHPYMKLEIFVGRFSILELERGLFSYGEHGLISLKVNRIQFIIVDFK